MTLSRSSRRSGAFAALLFVTSLLSCGRDITGPGGGARFYGSVAFAPRFETADPAGGDDAFNVASLVLFERVRIVITRDGARAAERVVNFGPTEDSVALQVSIPLTSGSSEGESFEASLQYINAAGDTVFRGGPITIQVRAGSSANPVAIEMPLTHTGPGSTAVDVEISPDSIVGLMGQTVNFTAEGRDDSSEDVPGAIIGFISRSPAVATIASLGSGSVQLVGARGTSWIIAELLDGAVDSAYVRIDPRPTSMILESGNGQFTLQDTDFALPLRVRVRAADNLGVAGWPVNFAVTSGQGTLDSTLVHTDANGYAEVNWTAGDSVGVATVTASIPTPALNVVFTGTQQASGPSSLTFESQPAAITAGQSLPAVSVAVRNGLNAVITSYTGPVALTLTGGTAGAAIVGDTNVNAVAGIATFTGLTVNRGGTNYRLVANVSGAPSQLSNTFNVAPAPPTTTALISGGGQSAPASSLLSDSIIVRVTDTFGFPVPGVTVNFAVTQGGGSVSPASGITNASGDVGTTWTLGATGPQQITATAPSVAPLAVSATVVGGGGGPSTMFAGYDYTYVAAGQSRTIPVFLSEPLGITLPVTFTTSNPAVLAWQSDSLEFAPGVTQLGVAVDALSVGSAWAIVTSALGTDSVFVLVDSAAISFTMLDYQTISFGDTIRVVVRISDPAPVGGLSLTVRSLDSAYFLVAEGTGRGVPSPGCVAGVECDGGDLRAAESDSDPLIIGSFGGTANVFIPEGGLSGYVAITAIDTLGSSTFGDFTAEAAGYVSAELLLEVRVAHLELSGSSIPLTEAIGEGLSNTGYVQRSVSSSTRDIYATLRSTDEESFTVDSVAIIRRGEPYSLPFSLQAHIGGTAYLVVEAPGFAPDSVLITVVAPQLRVQADAGSTMAIHESSFLRIRTAAAGDFWNFKPHTEVPVNLRVTADSVLELDETSTVIRAGEFERAITFRVVGLGDSYLVVESPGYLPDSVFISTYTEQIQLLTVSPNAGVGQFATAQIAVSNWLRDNGAHTISVTSLNPAIARVLTPTVLITSGQFGTPIQIEGLDIGDATIRLSGAGLDDLDFTFNVYAPGLTLSGAAGSWNADSVIRTVNTFSFDGGSGTRAVMDTVVAVLRSSDPSVVEVTDSIVTLAAGTTFSSDGKWRPVSPGSADLTVHAPGYTSSVPHTVNVRPFELFASITYSNLGQGLTSIASVGRNGSTGAALPVTITQTGPGAVGLAVGSDTIPAGVTFHDFDVTGVTLGEDTLIFTAAGYAPDTLVVIIEPATAVVQGLADPPTVGFTDFFVYAFLSNSSGFTGFAPVVETRFLVTSTDTLKARVVQDTIVISAGVSFATEFAVVEYLAPGAVQMVFTDVAGIIPPDTIALVVEPATLVGFSTGDNGTMTLGMGQRTGDSEVIVGPGVSLLTPPIVYLKSSNPSAVSVPDSIVLSSFQPFASVPITALDTVGSARITASSPGWNEVELDVVVTRTEVVAASGYTYAGQSKPTQFYVRDAITRSTHPLAAPRPMRVKSERPDVLDVDTAVFNFPTGTYLAQGPAMTGVSEGVALVSAHDTVPESDFTKMLSEAGSTTVYPSALYVTTDRYLVGLGLTSVSARNVILYGLQDSAWVRLTSVGGKFSTGVDSVLAIRAPFNDVAQVPIDIAGLVAGTDTLVIESDGFTPDTMLVIVRPGLLRVVAPGPAPTIVVGDSTLVTLQLRDAGDGAAVAHEALSLNFSIDSPFVVTDGTATVASVAIDPGAGTVSFWVKAVGSGSGELTVSSPNFESFRYAFTTRPIP